MAPSHPPRKLAFRRTLPIPVRLFGLAMLMGTAIAIYEGWSNGLWGAAPVVVLFGLPGLIMAAGAAGAVVDASGRCVRDWRGLHLLGLDLPVYRRAHPIDDFRVVVVTEEQWYGGDGGGGTHVYPVYLESWRAELGGPPDPGPSKRVLLAGPKRFVRGRATAEQVAKAVGLGVLDARDRSYRPAGTLDHPLAERLAQENEWPMADRPAGARSQLLMTTGGLQIDIPSPGVTPGSWVALTIAFTLGPALSAYASVSWIVAASLSMVAVLLVVVFGLVHDLVCERVVLDADELVIWRGIGRPSRRRAIARPELEELELSTRTEPAFAAIGKGSRVIAARSDRRVVEFAFGLPEAEQRWLLEALRARLGRPDRGYR